MSWEVRLGKLWSYSTAFLLGAGLVQGNETVEAVAAFHSCFEPLIPCLGFSASDRPFSPAGLPFAYSVDPGMED